VRWREPGRWGSVSAQPRIPTRIGRYEVQGVVGVGGFAIVLRGWDRELDAPVAIKVLLEELADDVDLRERFVREARLLRRIRDEHVVTVHDLGELPDGRPWFVLDYADRGTLADRLTGARAARRPSSECATLVDALASGLGALHVSGIVHRDVKPGNLLVRSRVPGARPVTAAGADATQVDRGLIALDEIVMVGDLGLAKDVRGGDRPSVLGGTPGYQAPEQLVAESPVGPAADVYAATAVLWRVIIGTEPPGPAEPDRLAVLDPAWARFFERGLAVDPAARFTTMAHWRAAALDEVLDGVGAMSATEAAAPSRVRGTRVTCPYKGLAAFQPEDAEFFVGREALVDELVRRLGVARVLVVGGPSGSGKSSLVRAGLMPAVAEGALAGSEQWSRVLLTPGSDPLGELHFHLVGLAAAGTRTTVDDLRAQPRVARRIVAEGAQAGSQVLLVIDQFEELFTLGADAADQETFVAVLDELTGAADSRTRVVLAMRADFYSASAQSAWLARAISENQLLVGPMGRAELRRAVEEPARRAGLRLEAGLVDRILEDAAGEMGTLPLVAHALVETWIRREGDRLTIAGYEGTGGVTGAIARSADALYEERFDEAAQSAARRLFLRLVTPGEATPDTRRRVAVEELEHDPEPEVLLRVVDRSTEARLLTVGDGTVELAHEALLRTWPRLHAWIDEERENLRTRQRIERAAREWDAQGREPDLLLRGTPLAAASEWVDAHVDQLDRLGRAFVDASVHARDEEERVAVAAAARSRRVRRVAVSVLAVLAAAAVSASVVAFIALGSARRNEDVAQERFARALATQSAALASDDPYTAMALAAESEARTDEPLVEAREALIESRVALAADPVVPIGAPLRVGDALAVALTPDGEVLAVGGRDGSVMLCDTATRMPIGEASEGHDGGVEAMTFVDATTLVTVGDDGRVLRWQLGADDDAAMVLGEPDVLGETDDVIWGVTVSPDASTLATASEDGTVRLWNAESGMPRGEPIAARRKDYLSVAFSPGGESVAVGNGDGETAAYDVSTGATLWESNSGHGGSDVWELAYTRGGELLSVGADGTVQVRDSGTGTVRFQAYTRTDRPRGLVVDDERRLLVGGDGDGRVVLWSLDERTERAQSRVSHDDAIIDAALDSAAGLLATLSRDQTVRLWDLAPRDVLGPPVGGVRSEGTRAVAWAPDGALLAVGDESGALSLHDVTTGDAVAGPTTGHDGAINGVAWSPNGERIATVGADGDLALWDAEGEVLSADPAHEGSALAVAFSPTGDTLVSAGEDGSVRRWDAATGEEQGDPLGPHPSGAWSLAFRPASDELAVGGASGTVRFWDVRSAELVRDDLVASTDAITGLAWSPDGEYIATASGTEAVDVWSAERAERVGASRTPHPRGATAVIFSRDGMTLVTAARDGTVRMWDRETGTQLGPVLDAHPGEEAWSIARAPDGDVIVTAGLDGAVRTWDVLDLARACELVGRAFDASTRARYLGTGVNPLGCLASS